LKTDFVKWFNSTEYQWNHNKVSQAEQQNTINDKILILK